MKKLFLYAYFCCMPIFIYSQKIDGLALTPPMGWNSWNFFKKDVTEDIIKEIVDALVATGLKDAGYEYVVIDDHWHGERDSLGFIQADAKKFPSGMKVLADYVHSKGLKFGIYSDAGTMTCGGRPGSLGHEYQDALKYAEWGVDYLKYDWCNSDGLNAKSAYSLMRDALYKAGRPIVFSLCEWGVNKPWEWGADVGHMWRTTGDIWRNFDGDTIIWGFPSHGVLQILDKQDSMLRRYAGPDHWNDPDMLEVGNGMSANEDKAHFSLWAMLCAPLMLGNDIRNMSSETIEILTNKDVIAVNQDKLGIQSLKLSSDENIEVWFKPLVNGDWAVCFLNRSKEDRTIHIDWKKYDFTDDISGKATDFGKTVYNLKNLWTGKDEKTTQKTITQKIPSHDVLMYRLTRKK